MHDVAWVYSVVVLDDSADRCPVVRPAVIEILAVDVSVELDQADALELGPRLVQRADDRPRHRMVAADEDRKEARLVREQAARGDVDVLVRLDDVPERDLHVAGVTDGEVADVDAIVDRVGREEEAALAEGVWPLMSADRLDRGASDRHSRDADVYRLGEVPGSDPVRDPHLVAVLPMRATDELGRQEMLDPDLHAAPFTCRGA